jgi:K+-sensing histidine kinase KdpD
MVSSIESDSKLSEEQILGWQLTNLLTPQYLAITSSAFIRTPLSFIIGNAEVILGNETDALSKSQKELLENILITAQDILEVLDNLFRMDPVEVGELSLSFEEVDLNRLIHTLVPENFEIGIPDQLPIIWGDRRRIKQIVGIIFSELEAVAATLINSKKTIIVSSDNTSVTFHVTVEGEFDPLSKIIAHPNPSLIFSKTVIEMHGGQMKLDEERNKLVLAFTLPRNQRAT